MTVEESKIEIQDIIDIYEKEDMYPLLNDRQISALKVAISALQVQDSPKPTAESVQNIPKEDLISRKAAIDALDCINGVEEVLRSLPSAQPEPCEDAVSRDSVKFLLCKETCHPGAFCPDGFCREICEKVDALPSATPKQRMGEWIPQDHNKTTGYATTLVYYYPKCSECGHTGDFSMNFCPNCGSYNGG